MVREVRVTVPVTITVGLLDEAPEKVAEEFASKLTGEIKFAIDASPQLDRFVSQNGVWIDTSYGAATVDIEKSVEQP